VSSLLDQLKGLEGLAIARQTVELMGRHHVTPCPQNYEIWLNYHLGTPAVCEAVDSIVQSGAPMNDQVNKSLYDRLFAGDAAQANILITSEQIARELSGVLAILESAGEKSSAYGVVLQNAAQALEQNPNGTTLRDLLASLAATTREMAEHNRQLNAQLTETSVEITGLRESLAQARSESVTDGLTGLANRRYFDEMYKMRLKEAGEVGTPLSLIVLDIDHFKHFNDTGGHSTGDQVIRFVGASLQDKALPDQLVARYGGEEFVVILPRKFGSAGQAFAEEVRRVVEGKKLLRRSTNEYLGRVTISAGVAELGPGEDGASLLQRADNALYVSKREGRNRVTLSPPFAPPGRAAVA
jgi:diguanylate cyclase